MMSQRLDSSEQPFPLRSFLWRFLASFFLLLLLLGSIILLVQRNHVQSEMMVLLEEEASAISARQGDITRQFQQVFSDLNWLVQQNELQDWLADGRSEWFGLIGREYLALSQSRGFYDQIRLLDNRGQELVRVNFDGTAAHLVDDDQLQDKGQRYYFRDTIKLASGETFVSPFDLNVERGRVEVPFKPMIRFGRPVFDADGQSRGLVLLNFLGERMLSALRAAGSAAVGDLMLLNSDGYWLSGRQPEQEWGFMFDARRSMTFQTDYPDIWQEIMRSHRGQMTTPSGVFTFATVFPLGKHMVSSHGSSRPDQPSTGIVAARDYRLYLVSHIPNPQTLPTVTNLQGNLIVFGLVMSLLALLGSVLLARGEVRRLRFQQQLSRMAHTDLLTGIPNRSLFQGRLTQSVGRCVRYNERAALMLIDLDNFKEVNDTMGHQAGDKVLIEVARRFTGCLRQVDTLARIGGDEFTALVSPLQEEQNAATVADKLLDSLSAPIRIGDQVCWPRASIGITVCPDDAADMDVLMRQADIAMYQAKKEERSCYCFYDPETMSDMQGRGRR